jgi:YggT family protein
MDSLNVVLLPALRVLSIGIQIYIYLLIAMAILSWLVAFDVLNPRSPVVRTIGTFLWRITEPALRPIRRILPNLGGIDISPVILILLLIFLQEMIGELALRLQT